MRNRIYVFAVSAVFTAMLLSLFPFSVTASQNPFRDADVQLVQATAPVFPASAMKTEDVEIYVVVFKDDPVVTHGAVERDRRGRPNLRGASARNYRAQLRGRHEAFLGDSEARIQRSPEVVHRYTEVLNGVAVRISGTEAGELARNPNVAMILRTENHAPLTDAGPQWIGADAIWDDDTGDGLESLGEGMMVGIVDTGINPTHPSFAEVAPTDNFMHANPFGSRNFVGVCDPSHPQHQPDFQCNDKLVGAYYFLNAWGSFPNEGAFDENGHGTHVASTAAGNRVNATFNGVDFDISGVAPRANVISYRVCGGPQTLCNTADSAAAIDQAVLDGVHVLNFSIGGGTNPAVDLASQAFLRATEAGVFVAAAAGNTPGAGTVSHRGAWLTTVANLTHNRIIGHPVSASGPAPTTGAPQNLGGVPGTGPAMPDIGVTKIGHGSQGKGQGQQHGDGAGLNMGKVEYAFAGHIDPANDLGCDPFPVDAFDGKIALIQRGVCTFADKVNNAAAAGAIAVVVFNSVGGAPIVMGALEATTIPAVMVSLDHGEQLVDWAAQHDPAYLSIGGTVQRFVDDSYGDVMSGTSSEGPAGGLADVLKPDVAAPGSSILAAFVPDDDSYVMISGTSMASPHVAGSAALLRSLHPDWTPLEVKSALMLTGKFHGVLKNNAITPADAFNIGGGRVQVDRAARAGLVLDEVRANFDVAYAGGDLTTLNLASFADQSCDGSCGWTRTLRNTGGSPSSWSVTVTALSPGLSVSAPSSLSVPGDGTATLSVSADNSGVAEGDWAFFEVVLEDAGGMSPDLRFSGAVFKPQPVQQGHYVAVSRNDDPTCAMPFANVGGYVDLTPFGITLQPFAGDTIGINAFAGNPIFHHGAVFADGLQFREDGFAFFHAPGVNAGTPWVNRPIPSTGNPTNFVAPLWHDWELVFDPVANRGSRFATGGGYFIADFKRVAPFFQPGIAAVSFQVAVRPAPAPTGWDIIFAYNDVNTNHHLANTTIGLENLFGTEGVQYAFNDATLGEIENGHAICFRWVPDNP